MRSYTKSRVNNYEQKKVRKERITNTRDSSLVLGRSNKENSHNQYRSLWLSSYASVPTVLEDVRNPSYLLVCTKDNINVLVARLLFVFKYPCSYTMHGFTCITCSSKFLSYCFPFDASC